MELALLVYAISLLKSLGFVLCCVIALSLVWVVISAVYYSDECTVTEYYSERANKDRRQRGQMVIRNGKRAATVGIISIVVLVLLPSEKTAYTMVGAYATQRVAEDPRVQGMSGKVLTIIEQKLDGYIEEGIAAVEKKTKGAK